MSDPNDDVTDPNGGGIDDGADDLELPLPGDEGGGDDFEGYYSYTIHPDVIGDSLEAVRKESAKHSGLMASTADVLSEGLHRGKRLLVSPPRLAIEDDPELSKEFTDSPELGGDYDIPVFVGSRDKVFVLEGEDGESGEWRETEPSYGDLEILVLSDGGKSGEWIKLSDLDSRDAQALLEKARAQRGFSGAEIMLPVQVDARLRGVKDAARGMADAAEFARKWDAGNIGRIPFTLDAAWTCATVGVTYAMVGGVAAMTFLTSWAPPLAGAIAVVGGVAVTATTLTMEAMGTAIPMGNFTVHAMRAGLPFGAWVKGMIWQAVDIGVGVSKHVIIGIPAKLLYDPSTKSLRDFAVNLEERRRRVIAGGMPEEVVQAAIAHDVQRAQTAEEKARYTRGLKRRGAGALMGITGKGKFGKLVRALLQSTDTGKALTRGLVDSFFPEDALEHGLEKPQLEGPVVGGVEDAVEVDSGLKDRFEREIVFLKGKGLLAAHQELQIRRAAGSDLEGAFSKLLLIRELGRLEAGNLLTDELVARVQEAKSPKEALDLLVRHEIDMAEKDLLTRIESAVAGGFISRGEADGFIKMMADGKSIGDVEGEFGNLMWERNPEMRLFNSDKSEGSGSHFGADRLSGGSDIDFDAEDPTADIPEVIDAEVIDEDVIPDQPEVIDVDVLPDHQPVGLLTVSPEGGDDLPDEASDQT